jgi:hypothetical protein
MMERLATQKCEVDGRLKNFIFTDYLGFIRLLHDHISSVLTTSCVLTILFFSLILMFEGFLHNML